MHLIESRNDSDQNPPGVGGSGSTVIPRSMNTDVIFGFEIICHTKQLSYFGLGSNAYKNIERPYISYFLL